MHRCPGAAMGDPSERAGTVFGTGGGVYHVRLDDGAHIDASLRGRLKKERRTGDQVVIGDRVGISRVGDAWTVERVDPRASELVRASLGGRRAKVVAANLDRVFVVVAAAEPDPTPDLVDRLLVVTEASGLEPLLVVNKADLDEDGAVDLHTLYRSIGYEVLVVSAVTRKGLPRFAEHVCRGRSALIGPSGAGKSSLLNALDPELHLRIGEISRRAGRGRHTTVRSRLIPLSCGGLVADTPGFGDVGVWGVSPDRVESCFPEIAGLAGACRFRGCAHRKEPDCAVRAGVENGEIPRSRYESYLTLRAEARAGRPWSAE